jgi:hypothetical protein
MKEELARQNLLVSKYKRQHTTAVTRALLVYLSFKLGFHEELFTLVEKTRSAFPQSRVAAKRCVQPSAESENLTHFKKRNVVQNLTDQKSNLKIKLLTI